MNWMTRLSAHFEKTRRLHPQDSLMILFDIDGTIIDMRFLIQYVLKKYDGTHGTRYFRSLELADITVHENHVDELLRQMPIPEDQQRLIFDFWCELRWKTESLMESHRPYTGVMEIIRWFQMQPKVFVGLNTGRPEALRDETLLSLNALGEHYNVTFTSEYLYMNPGDWEQGVPNSKIEGIRKFQADGYRIFAMVDNEPANLKAVYELDECDEILPLHAHTLFETDCGDLPYCSASGSDYVLSDLASEDDLPRDVSFVWHGVNDRANLRQFLGSDVEWGEIDVRADPDSGRLILHHDSLEQNEEEPERVLDVEEVVRRLNKFEKSIKFDFKENGVVVDRVLEILESENIDEARVWFNGNVEVLGREGFRKLRETYPNAVVQCPIDSQMTLIVDAPGDARRVLEELQRWGINRFSIEWTGQEISHVVNQLVEWGFDINIYNVPNLDSFLGAVLLKPRSITADFNFPKWHYFGRGSGQDGHYIRYAVEKDESGVAHQ